MYEVEDTVLPRFQPGNEGRPGNGTLRRRGGSEMVEAATVAEPSEVRESVPVALDKAGIHAIDSEYNHLRRSNGVRWLA
jgi:hypothetical protein